MRLDRGREHSVSVSVLKKGEAVYKETVGGRFLSWFLFRM